MAVWVPVLASALSPKLSKLKQKIFKSPSYKDKENQTGDKEKKKKKAVTEKWSLIKQIKEHWTLSW